MDNLPDEVQDILSDFGTCCSHSVWLNACVLVIGAILCTGKRTVTAALRVMGLKDDKRFTNFHRVLNRAKWFPLTCSKILLGKLIKLVPEDWPLLIIVDKTIERRNGPEIKAKGCYRDAVRSTEKTVVKCFGLKWISMMLVAKLPWSERVWALPFLTVLAPSKACNESENKRHKTTVDWTCQMIMQVSRWFPDREMILIGDGGYAAIKLGHCCSGLKNKVTLVSRLRLDAGLYDFPPQPQPGKRGPKPKKGKKQPTLADRVNDTSTKWNLITVRWYDGVERKLEFFSGESLWYTRCQNPLPIKWVVVRDPNGKLRTEAFFSTNLESTEQQILTWFVLRWNVEVTFEELRAHLGFETQRQWSDKAIARTTPALFGIFSIIVLMANEMLKHDKLNIATCAWYKKKDATFSDIIAYVRKRIWQSRYSTNSTKSDDCTYLKDDFLGALIELACYPN
jgi:hypothetical protein